jgi:hypothetical protein
MNTPVFSNLVILHTSLLMKMEQMECSETLAPKIQMPGNYPEQSMKHSEHDESLKSRISFSFTCIMLSVFSIDFLRDFASDSLILNYKYFPKKYTCNIAVC